MNTFTLFPVKNLNTSGTLVVHSVQRLYSPRSKYSQTVPGFFFFCLVFIIYFSRGSIGRQQSSPQTLTPTPSRKF